MNMATKKSVLWELSLQQALRRNSLVDTIAWAIHDFKHQHGLAPEAGYLSTDLRQAFYLEMERRYREDAEVAAQIYGRADFKVSAPVYIAGVPLSFGNYMLGDKLKLDCFLLLLHRERKLSAAI